jgi:sortase A
MSAIIEYVSMNIELVGTPFSTTGLTSFGGDGETVSFVLSVENNGSVPLTNFNFNQSQFDLDNNTQIPGKDNALTSGTPVHTLVDLWRANTGTQGARCPDPLPPGQTCTISGTVSAHQIAATDLNYVLSPSDPNQFNFQVFSEARSTTGSGLQTSALAISKVTVYRPIIEIGGFGPAISRNSTGNVWMFKPANFTATPNPAVNGQNITFTVILKNSSAVHGIQNMKLSASLNQVFAATDGYVLTQTQTTTPPAPGVPGTLQFTIPTTTLRPGESTTATATWRVNGITPPASLSLQLAFQGDVERIRGNYPAYNVTSDLFTIPVVADPLAPTTDPDGNALDPNATEPTITKTADKESANPGDSITWTIDITNPSTNQMASVTVVDNVPGDLEIVDTSATRGSSIVSGNLVNITTGSLAPGGRVTVTVNTNVSLEASVPGLITNTVCGQREGGTEVCAEAEVALGAVSDVNPATGMGATARVSALPSASRLPFLLAAFGVFFAMLFMSGGFGDRQRLIMAVLAILAVIIIVGGLLFVSSGGDDGDNNEEEGPSALDGSPPVDSAQVFPTGTPLPEEIAIVATPELPPTIAPEALATIASFPPTATDYILPTPAGPRRLDIPTLNYSIPVPIVELPLINGEWDVSNLGHNIGWLDSTTWLDPTWGNTVLAGHIQLSDTEPGPFQKLDRLAPGDEILVLEGTNITSFEVTEIFTVGPTETEVTHPTSEPMLTLITCTNWDESRGVFSDRLVIRAKRNEGVASTSGS